jgi:hypothetical protein
MYFYHYNKLLGRGFWSTWRQKNEICVSFLIFLEKSEKFVENKNTNTSLLFKYEPILGRYGPLK